MTFSIPPRYPTILRLEGFAGAAVKDIAADMVFRARQFGIPVALDMNGTHLLAFPTSTVAEIRRDYEAQLASREFSAE